MNRTHFRLWIFALFGALMSGAWATAEGIDPQLEKVLADWQKRQHRVETVEYQVRGEHKVPRGAYNSMSFLTRKAPDKENPPQDLVGTVGFTVFLDFAKGRHRRKIEDQVYNLSSGKLDREVMEDVFDGSVMKCLIPRSENPHLGDKIPEMTIVSGDMKNGAFLGQYYPIFFAHGRIHTAMEQIIPGQLRNKPDPDYLYVHGRGVHDGRACLILRTRTLKMSDTSFEEYWVDAPRESAILRYVMYSNGKPLNDVAISYRQTSAGWFPENWRSNAYVNGSLLYSEVVRVEKVQFDLSVKDADFAMEIKPGMLVEDRVDQPAVHPRVTPKSTLSVYRTKEGGGREEVPDPYHRKGDQYQQNTRSKNLWATAWLVLPLVGIAGFFLWWRYSKRTN
jgi:hypothetical protein